MGAQTIIEVLKGMAMFFIHPLTYLGLFLLIFIGIRRVKRERRDFHVRVYDFIDDFLVSFWPGLLAGLVVSLVLVAVGFVLPIEWVVMIGFVYLLLMLTVQVRFLSPAYVGALTISLGLILSHFNVTLPYFETKLSQYGTLPFVQVACLFSLLMLAEGVLIYKNGAKKTAPRLLPSKRGKYIGAHETKRVWLVPLIFFIPDGSFFGLKFWPIFAFGEEGFLPVLVPFFVGFHQLVKGSAPAESMKQSGRQMVALAIVAICLAVASYFYSFFIVLFLFVTILGREFISMLHRLKDENKPKYFLPREKGLIVLATIPNSTADKLGIKVGELIMKVNGEEVSQPNEFYLALQKNSAYCKLEVLDTNGEIRFVQGALYDGEHHQIGMIFIKEEYDFQNSII